MNSAVARIRDVDSGIVINPHMWGVFFEDINSAADGGLYAELVRNRDFSFSADDHDGWDPFTGWSADGEVSLGPRRPTGGHHVHLDGTRRVASIENVGFDGISVEADATYVLTVRGSSAIGARVSASIVDAAGATVAHIAIAFDDSSALTRVELTAVHTVPDAHLRVSVEGGAADLWWVSLVPLRSFLDDENGLRDDLARAIAELRPRFMRFPGGCVAHGFGLDNLYRWKNTLGPVEERVGDKNIWRYHQSMGLGFFEYFRFCEQIGASPLPVLAAGVCCQNSPGGQAAYSDAQMDEYVQDVLDLIEYANGPVDSRWGAMRAEAGHPEPFGLRYLGIGNEDEITDAFADRFERLLTAVREVAPDIEVIGTAGPFPSGSDYDRGWDLARRLNVDIVDEHSYKAPRWYFENLDRFDAYDRSGPRVYVGEYGSRGNTMLCALAEAAYMMGMERNGDIVHLASYAPLLAKIDHTQWTPDLLYFDNERVLPSLNYHVQRMHSLSAGTRALPVELEGGPCWSRGRSRHVGVAVRAESGTLTVEHAELIVGGEVHTTGPHHGRGALPLPLQGSGEEYTVRAQVRLEADGHDGFLVAFGDVDGPDHFEWRFGTWENRFLVLCAVSDGLSDEWTEPLPYTFTPGRTYDLEIRVSGGGRRVECMLDGVVMHDVTATDAPERRFSITSVIDDVGGALWLKVVNATEQHVPLTVELSSARSLTRMAVTVLTAEPDVGRAFEEAPATPCSVVVDDSTWVVPPYTFAVARVEADD